MNAHVSGAANGAIIFKDAPQPEPQQKPQRRPLDLAPVADEVSIPSALDAVPEEVLNSPASVRNVLEALDSAVSIRSDIDQPLKVRIARLEGDTGELRSELAAAKAEIAALKTALAKAETATNVLRTSVTEQARKAAAAAKAANDTKLARALAQAAEREAAAL